MEKDNHRYEIIKRMRIVLYGSGGFLENIKSKISELSNVDIIAIADSDITQMGKTVLGLTVCSIDTISIEYDYIVITSTYAVEIERNLIDIGIQKDKIIRWREFYAQLNRFSNEKYLNPSVSDNNTKFITAITPIIEFNGSFLALIYALESLRRYYNYHILLIASEYKKDALISVMQMGIDIGIYPFAEFDDISKWNDITNSDCIIVNTLLARHCLKGLQPNNTIWWLHESESSYCIEKYMWGDFEDEIYRSFHAYCVSDVARQTFKKFFPLLNSSVLEYGIPDFYDSLIDHHDKICVALIGFITKIKGHDILLDAIACLPEPQRLKFDFMIIGERGDEKYYREIFHKSAKLGVKMIDGVSHDKLEKIYSQFDVVIAPSRQDTMSVSITEGLMNHKLCILSDAVGISKYLKHGVNALIFESENIFELSRILSSIADNNKMINSIATNGRKIYEEFFSIEQVGHRFGTIISNMLSD